jgi:ABC-type dipeptide/oligopeptide/nickel transport system permease subunit
MNEARNDMDTKSGIGRPWLMHLSEREDILWLVAWISGLVLLWIWDAIFLNAPAFERIQAAFLNSLSTGVMVVIAALVFGWLLGVGLHLLERSEARVFYGLASFATDILRSIPQIIAVLIGYVVLTLLLLEGTIRSTMGQLVWIACTIAVAVSLEVADTVRERINYFRTLDFVDAMLSCGISETRIINVEILWKNSRSHLLHKLIAIFGVSIFLQCSIDFIISVGLSTDVSLSNFPVTLGSLLANVDSKQDILALSNLFTDPGYFSVIVVRHLQGISVAFCIVYTLLCVYMIANGFVRRHRLV